MHTVTLTANYATLRYVTLRYTTLRVRLEYIGQTSAVCKESSMSGENCPQDPTLGKYEYKCSAGLLDKTTL